MPPGLLAATHRPGQELAREIGLTLCERAHWSGPRCNWMGHLPAEFATEQAAEGTIASLGPDLYAGTAGVALFLARLHGVAGTRVLRRTAAGAMAHSLQHADGLPARAALGLYSGRLGIALAAVEVGRLLQDTALLARGMALADAAVAGPSEHILDLVGGAAGAILALLRLGALEQRGALLGRAERLGEELERAAREQGSGRAWEPGRASGEGLARRPLTGLAHGAAGMGLALAELHGATGRTSFARSALRAFAYEDGLFDREAGNWPDLRDLPATALGDAGPRFAMGWCHGAPGIGLARLRALELLGPRGRLRSAALAAVDAVRRHLAARAGDGDLTPCHGLLGQLELLQAAARRLGRPALRAQARREWGRALRGLPPAEWAFGTGSGGPTAGLMIGLAGIGHGLLRMSNPGRVPSVLVICP